MIRCLIHDETKDDDKEPLVPNHPYEMIGALATWFLPAGVYFSEVTETSVLLEARDLTTAAIITLTGEPREFVPVIRFIYYYMTQAEERTDLSVVKMLDWVREKIKERGTHVSLASEVPPLPNAPDLLRAVLYSCDVSENDFAEALKANTMHIAAAASSADELGLPFLEELREIQNDPEFSIEF